MYFLKSLLEKRGKLPQKKHFRLLHFAWTFHILFPHTFCSFSGQLIVFVDILKVTIKLSVLFLLFPGLCCACCCHRGKDHTCTQCCNPGDSRFWTVSPGLQIRVWNLPDINQRLPFGYRLDFPTINFEIFCVVCAILLLKSNISSINVGVVYYAIAMYQEILNNVKHCKFGMIRLISICCTNDVVYHAIWGHLSSHPYQFPIFEDVGVDSPVYTVQCTLCF